MKKKYLLFDIGGTKTRLALATGRKLGKLSVFETPKKFAQGIAMFEAYVRDNLHTRKLERAVGGIRGRLNRDKTKTFDRRQLSDWAGKPLVQTLKNKLKVPIRLENDADLAGLGEAVFGAGKTSRVVAYFTISTGVGGVRIVEGQIDTNVLGFEPGKQIINFDADLEIFEDYISGAAIKQRYGESPDQIEDEKIWDEIARLLAVGVYNSILHWSPNLVILGGGVMQSVNLQKVKLNLQEFSRDKFKVPRLKKSQFGDLAGLYGALALCRKRQAKPS